MPPASASATSSQSHHRESADSSAATGAGSVATAEGEVLAEADGVLVAVVGSDADELVFPVGVGLGLGLGVRVRVRVGVGVGVGVAVGVGATTDSLAVGGAVGGSDGVPELSSGVGTDGEALDAVPLPSGLVAVGRLAVGSATLGLGSRLPVRVPSGRLPPPLPPQALSSRAASSAPTPRPRRRRVASDIDRTLAWRPEPGIVCPG